MLYDLKHFKEFKHMGHEPIIVFFKRNKFGTNNPILTYLSILSPTDRCVILEALYDPYHFDSILNDKLLLAYVTNGKKKYAEEVIENSIQNGESDINIFGLRSKINLGLAPVRNRNQRLEIYNDFLSRSQNPIETEFLNLLIEFCNQYYK